VCGRYTVTAELDELVEVFDAPPVPGFSVDLPRYNVDRTQAAPVVALGAAGRGLASFRWGLVPFWAEDPSVGSRLINARAESVHRKPAFREAFQRRRCLVPADGFYEWLRPPKGQGPKRPFWFHRPDRRPFALAGLWERWGSREEPLLSFTILTTRANATVRQVHDRMPVVLPPEAWAPWLDADTARESVAGWLSPPAEDELDFVEVSTTVNSPSNDGPECIEASA
jgi:putative SOS response-associated peptidase YedK